MDKTLLLFINREWTNPFMDRLMATFTSFDVWMPLLILAGLILLWRGNFRVRSFLLVTLLTIAFTDGVFTQFMKKLDQSTSPESGAGRGARSEPGENQAGNSRRLAAGSSVTFQTARGSGDRAIVPVGARHEQHRHCHHGYSFFWEARSPLHHSLRE